MATRRPLVRFDGRTQELPPGDSVAGAGGGAVTASIATTTVAPAVYYSHEFTVAEIGTLPTQSVECWFGENDDYEFDDLDDHTVTASAGTDQVLFSIFSDGPIVGEYKIYYRII
jgi:hypothetical protein